MKKRSRTIELELQGDTREVPMYSRMAESTLVPALTVLHHPRLMRVGDRVRLGALAVVGGVAAVSRLTPDFGPPGTDEAMPLGSAFLSRKPIALTGLAGGGVAVDASQGATLAVDGAPLTGRLELERARVEAGVVLVLSGQVILLLHLLEGSEEPTTGFGHPVSLVGASDALRKVREAIGRVAGLPGPVLVRGETGTGKELVARALHLASPRRDAVYLPVNMAAIAPTLAASELFGHAKGSFSGAHQASLGMFGRADGGTLFMDEIGDTPLDVQAALLRVLETGEVQQVGADRVRTVDVRLIAATDADLDAHVASGRFRAPLRYRLASQEIKLPPLRARVDDIGRLLVHFVGIELATAGRAAELGDLTPEGTSWIPAGLVLRLVRYAWPGNVRQLRNVARWLASLDHRGSPIAIDDPGLDGLLGEAAPVAVQALASATASLGATPATLPVRAASGVSTPSAAAAGAAGAAGAVVGDGAAGTGAGVETRRKRAPSEIGAEELERVMAAHEYKLGAVADELGISRPALNELVDAHPRLRRAQVLTKDEIVQALAAAGGAVERAWRELRVSEKSLRLRMSALGLS